MALKITGSILRIIKNPRIIRLTTAFYQKSHFLAAIRSPIIQNMHCFSTNTAEIVSYEEIKKLPGKSDTVLIDVREPQELKDTGVVPTSINIPCQVAEKLSKEFSDKEFLKLFNRKKPNPDTEIIFMCKIGGRSHKAMELTRTLGYKNVKNYLGSWEDWSTNEGLTKDSRSEN